MRGNHIENSMTADLTMTYIPRVQEYPNFQNFRVSKSEAHMNT
jgi:putative salt-induced outer membrane protein YdiY